jgi:polyhydroxyalkanoate synthesis repressor PhaR
MSAATRRAATSGSAGKGPRILKKYPNRRLYDTHASSYITLADVKKMVLDGEEFEVRDAKSSEDLTRSILLQIILEEETGGMPIFSTDAGADHPFTVAMVGMRTLHRAEPQTFVDMHGARRADPGVFDPKAFTPET